MHTAPPTQITIKPSNSQDHALRWAIPLVAGFTVLYGYLYWPQLIALSVPEMLAGTLSLMGLIIMGTVVHEGLHGLTWAVFCQKHFQAIRFGIFWEALMPYCHCKAALRLNPYRLGVLMPGLLLGLIPLITGILTGWLMVALFGLYFTYSAIGDFRMVWRLRAFPRTHWVKDHPEQIGCLIYKEKPDTESHE